MIQLFSDSEIKITPAVAGRLSPTKGFGYSFSNNAKKLLGSHITQFAVGAVSDLQTATKSAVAVFTSRPTIAIEPQSPRTNTITFAENSNNPGKVDNIMCNITSKRAVL